MEPQAPLVASADGASTPTSCPAIAPVVSNSASCAMRRAWRSSPENGVAMKVSM
jgi:hypothetical protein